MADKVWPSKEPQMPVAARGAGPAPVCYGRQGGRPSDRDGGFLNQGQWGSGRRGKVGEGRRERRGKEGSKAESDNMYTRARNHER